MCTRTSTDHYSFSLVLRTWRKGAWHSDRMLYGCSATEDELRYALWTLIAKVLELNELLAQNPRRAAADAIQDALPGV